AFGATYKSQPVGSLGDAACFSFFPTKNFSTMGDGGIVTTSNQKLAEKIRKLRVHGSQTKYHHDEIGYNSRLDENHAGILLASLPPLNEWNCSRITLANRYKNKLNHLDFIKLPSMHRDGSHVFHLFSLATDYRTEIIKHLQAEGIQAAVYYPRCIHL